MVASLRFPVRHIRWAVFHTQQVNGGPTRALYSKSTDLGPRYLPVSSTKLKDGDNLRRTTGETKEATPRKTVAESDGDLRRILEDISGGGGASGVETEDGKPTTMKKAVKNMFRYI